jgi:DsbC/DsbD-like thiol-disulfide interchange protein
MLLMALCLPAIWPQSSPAKLSVGQPQTVAGKRNASVSTKLPVSILPGFHVNNNAPLSKDLIPLSITWTSLGALQGAQVSFPKAETIDVVGEKTLVFTGNIELGVSFKIAANAPAGPGVATGTVRYQACNDRQCFPPKTVEFNVPYQVQ